MNRRKSRLQQIHFLVLGMLACILFVLSISESVSAKEQDAKKVRIGYYPVDNYQEIKDDGTYYGFSYDYFIQIQKYTRWEYEFVRASYAECLQMLAEGEVDVVSGVRITPERQEQMIFSRQTVSTSQIRFFTKADNENLYYESFDTFDGCEIGIMKGTLIEEVEAYEEQHHFKANITVYDTIPELYEAFETGKIDIVCATSMENGHDTKIVGRMERQPLYFAIARNREDIAEELEDALLKITDNNPDFFTQLSEKYMISGANANATFTREEMEYINSKQKVYLIINPDWAPISWRDSKTGEYRGIFVDVIRRIEEYSGITFQLCTEAEYNKMAETDSTMDQNVVAILADDTSWVSRQGVMMSNHVVDSSVVMVTRRDFFQKEKAQEDMVIALPERFYIRYGMREELKDRQVVDYDTVAECLDAVNTGKADMTFVNELVSTYYLSKLKYSELYATANSGYYENLAFAVNKESEAPLLSILDKSLLCIGATEMEQIVIQNSIAEERNSIIGLIYSNPGFVASVSAIAMVILVSIGLYIYWVMGKKKRAELELQRETETNAARTEFFLMISHELRTPLNAIVGYLDLAAEQCRKNGWELEYIKRSQNASKQLTTIAEDMLDYTRISSNTMELREELFDIKDVILNVDQNMSIKAMEKNLSYHFRISDITHEYVIGDELRVGQIIQNILSNAIKFTAEGGEVDVKVSEVLLDNGLIELHFICRDTGKGMPEEFLQKVCAPFKQSDQSYSRTHGGLGLGLYLTKYFISLMHGTLQVESEQGKGSCFTITMPMKRPNSEQIISQHIDCSHVRTIIGGTSEEDNSQLRDLLKRLHMKCDMATEPDKLIKRMQSRMGGDYEYALCVLDESFLIPDMGVVEQINALEHTPVIFAVTNNSTQIDSLLTEGKANQVLYKPIFQSVLFDAVMNTFGEYSIEEQETGEDFTGIRAMIVEDNLVNADILSRILKKVNIEATVCENGQIAVDTFEREPEGTYHIIFMDIQMPVMDGYEATRAIRNAMNKQGKTIPILAVSANAFPEDIEKSIESGMNAHIAKPVKGKTLYQYIREYCVLAALE